MASEKKIVSLTVCHLSLVKTKHSYTDVLIMHAWVKLYGPHAESTPLALLCVPAGLAFAGWQTRWQVETDEHICAGGGRK